MFLTGGLENTGGLNDVLTLHIVDYEAAAVVSVILRHHMHSTFLYYPLELIVAMGLWLLSKFDEDYNIGASTSLVIKSMCRSDHQRNLSMKRIPKTDSMVIAFLADVSWLEMDKHC